ncbi:MAG: PEGA domain-containing protein [Spirochaetaceae bacterium]|nr:MAG: PEGA domain-containing protein [Spirochaetaceae bacterium]
MVPRLLYLFSVPSTRYTQDVRYLSILLLLIAFSISAPPLGAQSTAVIAEIERDSGVELHIRTLPDDADVAINGRYVGRTPLTIRDLSPGTVRVTLSRSGYRTVERWVRLRDQSRVELDVVLEQQIGILSLVLEPPDAEVFIDGVRRTEEVLRLPIGDYTIYVTRFGYNDHRERITIRENRTTLRQITLKPAAFEVHNLSLSRSILNPLTPGAAGSAAVRFDVTAAGSATLMVRDAAGRPVYRDAIADFDQRRQRFSWDGRDASGLPVPSGDYTLQLRAHPTDHGEVITRTLSLTVDRTLPVAYRSTRSSSSGALLAPDVLALPRGVFQLHSAAAGGPLADGRSNGPLAPAHLGLRLGIGNGMEVAATADGFFSDSISDARLQGAASLRWVYAASQPEPASLYDSFMGALQASLVLGPTEAARVNPADATANWPSLRLGLPFGLHIRHFRAVLTPELVLSHTYPARIPRTPHAGQLLGWGYARAALIFDHAGFTAAASAALRSKPFTDGAAIAGPLYSALEVHQLVPQTPLALTLFVTSEARTGSDLRLSLGGGLGILY